jgi:hypothetical protein
LLIKTLWEKEINNYVLVRHFSNEKRKMDNGKLMQYCQNYLPHYLLSVINFPFKMMEASDFTATQAEIAAVALFPA